MLCFRHLNLPGSESQRKTHTGVIVQRFSGFDSRLSSGTTARAHSHLHNPVQSRLSAIRQNPSKHSRMSATQRSRISHARSVRQASSSDVKNGANASSVTSVPSEVVPEMKRASKSYALASDIINNREDPERGRLPARISVKMPSLFNMNNSIIADQRNSKFTSQSTDGGKITQPINTLDDLKIKRGNSRHKRSQSSSSNLRSKKSSSSTKINSPQI